MHPRIVPVAGEAPRADSAAYGAVRAMAARSAATGLEARIPAATVDGLLAWLDTELAGASEARGLTVAGMSMEWLDALGWTGVPLAQGGSLTWGRDLVEDAAALRPILAKEGTGGAEAVLRLPPRERLRELGSLDLKPLRAFIATRLGCRLQVSAGVQLFLWDDRALLVSCADMPVAGFFHGPIAGQRATVAIDPGGFQMVRW